MPIYSSLRAQRSNPESVSGARLDCSAALAMTATYFFPARLSRNTPCSPNIFQNHQGMLKRSGRA